MCLMLINPYRLIYYHQIFSLLRYKDAMILLDAGEQWKTGQVSRQV